MSRFRFNGKLAASPVPGRLGHCSAARGWSGPRRPSVMNWTR